MFKKEFLRQSVKDIFEKYTENELSQKSEILKEKILKNPIVLKSKTIGFFVGGKFEVETKSIILELINLGKEIYLPKVIGNDEMIFCKINSLEDLCIGKFNILEPIGNIKNDKIELFLVPGISFTKNGKRIGKGKGYYDKYFSKHKNNYKIGICFDFQIFDDFEVCEFDVLMDEVIF